jgi:hypothetical protein
MYRDECNRLLEDFKKMADDHAQELAGLKERFGLNIEEAADDIDPNAVALKDDSENEASEDDMPDIDHEGASVVSDMTLPELDLD